MKKAIVFGAGGFIGNQLVKRLKSEGYWVKGIDLKYPDFDESVADEFIIGDLRIPEIVENGIIPGADELYQLAADMGGAGYLFTGENDASVMYNSALINLYSAQFARLKKVKKAFFSSSACVYPKKNQEDPLHPNCKEDAAYPAEPDSNYGWEKLFSERLYQAFSDNYGLNIRIARFHNVYGPGGPWRGGREKAPAAICRKIALAKPGEEIEVWGDGKQTRSFLFIHDCIDAIRLLMEANYAEPVNIGSEEIISIGELVQMVIGMSEKKLTIKCTDGPVGVRGRNSENSLIRKIAGWNPVTPLKDGIYQNYRWIEQQLKNEFAEYGYNKLGIV